MRASSASAPSSRNSPWCRRCGPRQPLSRPRAGRGGFSDQARHGARAREAVRGLGFKLDPPVGFHLSRAEQQMVEIAKAIQGKPRVLILDEPTASLTEKETRKLCSASSPRPEAQGRGHHLHLAPHPGDSREIADRITVLRDGRMIGTVRRRMSEHAAGRTDDRARRSGALSRRSPSSRARSCWRSKD